MDIYTSWSNKGRSTLQKNNLNYKLFKIAVCLAKKHYENVYIVTDSESADILNDFPFTKIYTILDKKMPDELWWVFSLSKLFCLEFALSKNKPFIYIDHDAFLYEKLPDELTNSGIFAEFLVPNAFQNYGAEYFINNLKNKYLYESFDSYKIDYAANMPIFGGHDLEFLKFYVDETLKLVLDPKNMDFIRNNHEHFWSTCMVEQYYMSYLANMFNKKVNYLYKYPQDYINIISKYWHVGETKFKEDVHETLNNLIQSLKINP